MKTNLLSFGFFTIAILLFIIPLSKEPQLTHSINKGFYFLGDGTSNTIIKLKPMWVVYFTIISPILLLLSNQFVAPGNIPLFRLLATTILLFASAGLINTIMIAIMIGTKNLLWGMYFSIVVETCFLLYLGYKTYKSFIP